MEVIYTGLFQTPESIAQTAVDEDVDVVGLSILSGAHNQLVPEVIRALREHGKGEALILVGGIIPQDDIPFLKAQGVAEVFGPGTSLAEIVRYIESHVPDVVPNG